MLFLKWKKETNEQRQTRGFALVEQQITWWQHYISLEFENKRLWRWNQEKSTKFVVLDKIIVKSDSINL